MEPNWLPLEGKLGPARCVGFMFMGHLNGINIYKHGISRTYLHLDDEGNCYTPGERGRYISADWAIELARLEACLAALGENLRSPYDEQFITRRRKALQQHGISLLTVSVEPCETHIH